MLELDAANAASYLAERGFDPASLRIRLLGGGVSNTVLLAETPGMRLVLKQSLGKLRVEQDWFSDRARIFRESAAIRMLRPCLPPGAAPEILFEDRENCLFAMSAAAPGARTWKSLLLDGAAEPEIAEHIARIMAAMVRAGAGDAPLPQEFGDQTVFDQLRLDPYYRTTAARHPGLAPFFFDLIDECRTRQVSLVHGDWSPKNFLIDAGSVMAIDFEVIHFGNPAFDAAFLLNHLLLKSFYRPQWIARYATLARRFWETLVESWENPPAWFESSTVRHLAGLLLARIDGKSPAEYIRGDALREKVRKFARGLIAAPPDGVSGVLARLAYAVS